MADVKEKEEKIGGKGWLGWFIAWTICWILTVLIFGLTKHPFWAILSGLIGTGGGIWLFINFVIPLFFAPRDLSWVPVGEAEAVLVMKGGKYEKTLMNYKGFYQDGDFIKRLPEDFDPPKDDEKERKKYFEDNGIPGQHEDGLLGGIKWIGFPPSIHQVAIVHQHWKSFRENEKGKVKEYDEYLRAIKLFLDQFIFDYKREQGEAIEDINKVPVVGVRMVVPIRIYNPRSAMLDTKNWVESTGATLWPILENLISCFRWDDDLITMKAGKEIVVLQEKANKIFPKTVVEGADLNALFWEILEESVDTMATYIPKIDIPNEGEECFSVFGVILYKKGFRVYKIDPDSKYREDANKRYEEEKKGEAALIKAEMDGKAAIIKAEKEALAAAKEGEGVQNNLLMRTSGFVIKALSDLFGLTEDEVRIKVLSKEFEESYKMILEEGRRLQAMDAKQFSEVVFPKGSTIEGILQALFKK